MGALLLAHVCNDPIDVGIVKTGDGAMSQNDQ